MIAIITPNPDTTAETFVRQHIRLIAPDKTVVIYFNGEGKAVKTIPSIKVSPISKGSSKKVQQLSNYVFYGYPGVISGQNAKAVTHFLKEYQIKSVLAEFGPTGCAIAPICQKLGIKLVVNFHGHDATVMPRRRLIRRAYRFLNQKADVFICGSEHFKKVLINLGFTSGKISVIPCGIEVEKFQKQSIEKDPNLVIAVGRFVEKKAPHLTIRAFDRVAQFHPQARLEMIGEGPLMSNCKALIEELGITKRVTLHGAQSHEFVKQKLARASVFAQHSIVASNGDTESQGISLLEAMASKIPVVVTTHNGFVETVTEGVTGYLVPEKDYLTMGNRIYELLNDEKIRQKMGNLAFDKIIQNFEAHAIAQKLNQILNNDLYSV